jgi:hypothetical protein
LPRSHLPALQGCHHTGACDNVYNTELATLLAPL